MIFNYFALLFLSSEVLVDLHGLPLALHGLACQLDSYINNVKIREPFSFIICKKMYSKAISNGLVKILHF